MRVFLTAAVLGTVSLLAQGLATPTPAHAACADDAAMTKEMAMAAADGDSKEMALKHVTMAMEKFADFRRNHEIQFRASLLF